MIENKEPFQFAGKHLLGSYLGCDLKAICDIPNLLIALDEAVKASGATILNRSHHVFAPHGLTVAYLLSESHASVHTYPEHGAIFVDLFTCGDHCSAIHFDAALRAYLKPQKVAVHYYLRDEKVHEIPLC